MNTYLAAAALASIGTVLASPAQARQNLEETTVMVKHDDLNLASVRGQKLLEWRIRTAAEQVCGYREGLTGTRVRDRKTDQCFKTALNQGMNHYAALMTDRQFGG